MRCRRARRARVRSPRGNARASPAVVNVAGMRSGARRAQARNAVLVPSPIAATFARTADGESSLDASISTVARLVSVIHANPPADRSRSAAVSAADRAGTISIVGAMIAVAPRRRSRRTSSTDWSAGLVTRTVRPASGFIGRRPAPRGSLRLPRR